MDLKNLETTSTLAIEAVYKWLWTLIPNKYKIPEDDKITEDMEPFYDPELNFDNRLHYKLTNVAYKNRPEPWFVITWNTESGLLKSSLSQRRFQSAVVDTEWGKLRFKFINTDLQINFAITSNTMQGLYELQENLILKMREKIYCYTRPHHILGSFPVSMNVIDGNQNKMSRDKGTLCYLFLQVKIDFPIIGNVEKITGGIIEEIHLELDKVTNTINQPLMLATEIIKSEDDEEEN